MNIPCFAVRLKCPQKISHHVSTGDTENRLSSDLIEPFTLAHFEQHSLATAAIFNRRADGFTIDINEQLIHMYIILRRTMEQDP